MFRFGKCQNGERYTVTDRGMTEFYGTIDKISRTKWIPGQAERIGGKTYWKPYPVEFKTRKEAAEYLYRKYKES